MVCLILCTECGEDLAEIFPFYDAVKNGFVKKTLEEKKVNIETLDIRADIIGNLDFIFKALYIKNQCCKMHLLGTIDLDDHFI